MLGWQESFNGVSLESNFLSIARDWRKKLDILQMPLSDKTFSGISSLEKNFAKKFHQLWEKWQIKTAQVFVAHPLNDFGLPLCIFCLRKKLHNEMMQF